MAVDHKRGAVYPEQYRKDTADFVMASGRTIKQCAADLGVNDKTLSNWVADRKRELGTGGTARLKPAGDKADPELAAARRRIKELEMENDFFKEGGRLLRQGAGVGCLVKNQRV